MMDADLAGTLEFLRTTERLKTTYRSGFTSDGRHESVAEHTRGARCLHRAPRDCTDG